MLKKLIFLVVVIILYIWLRSYQTIAAMGNFYERSTDNTVTIYVLLLFGIVSLYLILYKKNIYTISLQKRFILWSIIVYVISIIHSLFSPFSSNSDYFVLLLPILLCTFFSHYYFNVKDNGLIYSEIVISLLVCALFVNFITYYNVLSNLVNLKSQVVVNSSYVLLFILPFVLLMNNWLLKWGGIILISIAVILSAKRGGFLALTLALAAYYFINQSLVESNKNKFTKSIWITSTIGIFGYFLWSQITFEDTLIYQRLLKMEDDNGSGRIEIWANVIDLLVSTNPLNLLFGHGYNSVVKDSISKLSAHNDFLEILYDFGIFSFIIFISLHYKFIKCIQFLISKKSKFAAPLAASFVLLLINELVSHIFLYTHHLVIFASFWGMVAGLYMKEKSESYKNQFKY